MGCFCSNGSGGNHSALSSECSSTKRFKAFLANEFSLCAYCFYFGVFLHGNYIR